MSRFARLLIPALLVLAGAPAHAGDLVWRPWNAGLKEADNSHRPVLVDVYTGWCGWCKRMDRDVYQRTDVRDYLTRKFVTVKLDAETDDAARYEGKAFTYRTLASRFRVSGYPTTIFLASSGEHLANVPGYIPADRFLLLLHYVGDGWMDKGVSFDDYVKKTAEGDDSSAK
jgi:thioredoxin-related protein